MKVIESFVSWQGEGNDTGKRMLILRFKYCNRNCKFCDTSVKMRTSVETEISLDQIQKIVDDEKCSLLITGGEPTVENNLVETINLIENINNCQLINVETNGSGIIKLIKNIERNKNIVKYSLSPKLFSTDDLIFYKALVSGLVNNENVFIKLVYEDNVFINTFLDFLMINIKFNNQRVFLMPEGKTREEVLNHAPKVFDVAEKYKVNFSSREHIIYGFV